MANPITSKDIAAVAKITASSTLSGYQASDLLDWIHPYRVWKGSAAISTSDNIVIDFGVAPAAISAVFLDNLNSNSVKVQGHTSDSWGTPSFSSTLSVALDRADGRYKLFAVLAGFTYRYLRILNNSATSLNGEPGWQIGSIAPVYSHTTWAWSVGYPYEISPQADILGQGSNVVRVGNRGVEIRMTQSLVDEGSETSFADVFGYGEAEPFLFYRNYTSTAEAYPVRRVGAASWQKIGANAISVPTFTFREYD